MLHKLEWRYATKMFDKEREIKEEDLTTLLEAMNLTASSYGLQPYEFVVVKKQEMLDRLKEVSFQQSQISDASHLIVICAKTEISSGYIDSYISNIAHVRGTEISTLEPYAQMMKQTIGAQDAQAQLTWSQKQCYTVLGTLLLACADLKIDACPMEGFIPESYNEILGLKEHGLHATIAIPIGYRHVQDSYQHAKKVRKQLADMVHLKYE